MLRIKSPAADAASVPLETGTKPGFPGDLLNVGGNRPATFIITADFRLPFWIHPARDESRFAHAVSADLTNRNHCISRFRMKGVCRVIGIRFKAKQFFSTACPFEAFGVWVRFDIQCPLAMVSNHLLSFQLRNSLR
jgi:hypothetical protein